MIPNYKAVHNKFKLNGYHYTHETLKEVAYSFVKEGDVYEKQLGDFLLDWLDSNDAILVNTSGSTGIPKSIKLQKQAMVNSALATGDYFKLKPGDSALLCLPTSYIAGKMMIVRAIILGLNLDLVYPSSNPLEHIARDYDFTAMVPMQLENSLSSIEKIRVVIVGGAKVSKSLSNKLESISDTEIYETYGMTETVTHIAARKLNNNENKEFEVLPNIKITQDQRDCLVIDAPHLADGQIVTNDIVKLHSESSFELLGRIDNVINSGGIKMHPEQLETKLDSFIDSNFFIASSENKTLGEEVVLVVEGKENSISSDFHEVLNKHEIPKKILFADNFIRTSSGKINRVKTLESLKKLS